MATKTRSQLTADESDPHGRAGRLLTASDVADTLRVSEGTLRNWRSAERGPRFAKVGGSVRYREEDVAAWIEDNLETVY